MLVHAATKCKCKALQAAASGDHQHTKELKLNGESSRSKVVSISTITYGIEDRSSVD